MGRHPETLSWKAGKEYDYNILLGVSESTGGLYLSEYYVDEYGNNTKIRVPSTQVTDAVNRDEIHFDSSVDSWVDAGSQTESL